MTYTCLFCLEKLVGSRDMRAQTHYHKNGKHLSTCIFNNRVLYCLKDTLYAGPNEFMHRPIGLRLSVFYTLISLRRGENSYWRRIG